MASVPEPGRAAPADPTDGRCGPGCFTLDSDGFTCTRLLDAPEVWRVELLMGDTFLPSVNAFVVRDAGQTLVVDTGTPDDYNDTRLMRALLRLGADPARTTLFCTHAHRDHAGLARELALAGVRVLVPAPSLSDMRAYAVGPYRDRMVARLVSEGADPADADLLAGSVWGHTVNLEAEGVSFETVEPKDEVRCGRWAFTVVHTPGHTPGHCVLWLAERRVAFVGDAVLFACSTCVNFQGGVADSLGDQLRSLELLAGMGIERAFLGHGLQAGDVAERCLANVAHHERRSARLAEAIAERPGRTGFELVETLGWHASFDPARSPALTRWFLASESIAHLDHLVAEGAVLREAGRYYPRS